MVIFQYFLSLLVYRILFWRKVPGLLNSCIYHCNCDIMVHQVKQTLLKHISFKSCSNIHYFYISTLAIFTSNTTQYLQHDMVWYVCGKFDLSEYSATQKGAKMKNYCLSKSQKVSKLYSLFPQSLILWLAI